MVNVPLDSIAGVYTGTVTHSVASPPGAVDHCGRARSVLPGQTSGSINPAGAVEPDAGSEDGAIGIRLLEAPADRRTDPRALRYVVNHLPPGTTINRQLLIVNRTDETRHVDVYPAAATLEASAFRFGEGRAENELTSWVTLDQRAVELQPWGGPGSGRPSRCRRPPRRARGTG